MIKDISNRCGFSGFCSKFVQDWQDVTVNILGIPRILLSGHTVLERRGRFFMRLLVVEDDAAIQGFLKRALTESGFQVDTASDAATGEQKALEGIHDAFIIDLGLPDMDGLDLIVRCRAQGISGPVLILSARRSVDERVRGLERGGDDYLTKPFAFAELLARLRNLLRRSLAPQNDSVHLQAADLQLDLVRHEARRGDHLL